MVTLEGKIRVPQAQREATNAALVEHVALTRAEDGCLFFEVVPDPVDPEGFRVREAFLGPDAFAAHQSRVANSAWGRLTKDFQRQYEVSGLTTRSVTTRHGWRKPWPWPMRRVR